MLFTRSRVLILSVIVIAAIAAVVAYNSPEIDYYAFGDAVPPVAPPSWLGKAIELETELVRMKSVRVNGQDASPDVDLIVPAAQDVELEIHAEFKRGAWRNVIPPSTLSIPPKGKRHLPIPSVMTRFVCRTSFEPGQLTVEERLCRFKNEDDPTWQGSIPAPGRKGVYLLQFFVRAMHSADREPDIYLLWNRPVRVE